MAMIRPLAVCLAIVIWSVGSLGSIAQGADANSRCCPVVELRQYTTLPGKRDSLVQLFEDHFIESQEAAGIALPGQFRVVGFPNRFDWLQGFSSMSARKTEFESFYFGSAWKARRKAVNSLLLENGNVILLHPAHNSSGFAQPPSRPPLGSTVEPKGLIVATIYYLGSNSSEKFDRTFETTIRPVVRSHGANILASFVTDHSRNNFPILPVREDVNLFVWFACYADEPAYDRYRAALSNDPHWLAVEGNFALAEMYIPPEVDILRPTPRSSLRCPL